MENTAVGRLNEEYFRWLYDLVCPKRVFHGHTYINLLRYLHEIEFTYILPKDRNRAEDGIEVRYRFGHENGYEDSVITLCMDAKPCSVLEMMVALAIRCEDHIMWDPEVGNRTPDWFWLMANNLGLDVMTDSYFVDDVLTKINIINETVQRFLNREYMPNGQGGLFVIENCQYDLRQEEIWYQMCWYLNKILRH